MKLSRLPLPLLVAVMTGISLSAFLAGNQVGRWLFPVWTAPSIAQAAPAIVHAVPNSQLSPMQQAQGQENTLFVLLGDAQSGTRPTVWHISGRPGSPVFMRLLVPSARFGEEFDRQFDALGLSSESRMEQIQALEALFAVHGLSWDRVVILKLEIFLEALAELNKAGKGQFSIVPAQVLASLPRQQDDARDRLQIIRDQIEIWSGLCPLFLSTPVEWPGDPHLFRPYPAYPVCLANDDLH